MTITIILPRKSSHSIHRQRATEPTDKPVLVKLFPIIIEHNIIPPFPIVSYLVDPCRRRRGTWFVLNYARYPGRPWSPAVSSGLQSSAAKMRLLTPPKTAAGTGPETVPTKLLGRRAQ